MKARGWTRETINSFALKDLGFPPFEVGDAVAISLRVKEGDKERLQVFEGDVLCIRKNGASSSFTVRKIGANSVAVERVLPFCSPMIASIKLLSKGKCRKAKLYYMRDRIGKKARVKEEVLTRQEREACGVGA